MSINTRIKALPVYEAVRTTDPITGERLYLTPSGESNPSVTTILSGSKDQTGLMEWRESVGEAIADQICKRACRRGTGLHLFCENWMLKQEEPAFDFQITPYWNSIKGFVKTVEKPLLIEGTVWHSSGYAGMLDCIAYLPEDGDQPTLIDWKSADRPCKKIKIYEYGLQCAAYVAAANEVYKPFGLDIQQAKIVVALPNETPTIETLDRNALDQLFLHFLARKERFVFARKGRF
jgi:hypothetical protein